MNHAVVLGHIEIKLEYKSIPYIDVALSNFPTVVVLCSGDFRLEPGGGAQVLLVLLQSTPVSWPPMIFCKDNTKLSDFFALPNFRKVSKFAASIECSNTKSASASGGGLRPRCPLTRGSAPEPRWVLRPQNPIINSRYRARHMGPCPQIFRAEASLQGAYVNYFGEIKIFISPMHFAICTMVLIFSTSIKSRFYIFFFKARRLCHDSGTIDHPSLWPCPEIYLLET